MRTKTLFYGLKNSQRIRLMVNGFGIMTTVQSVVHDIVTTTHQQAVVECLNAFSKSIEESDPNGNSPTGIGGNWNEVDVQVDLA